MRRIRPQRVLAKAQAMIGASTIPTRNSAFTLSAACTCALSLHQPRPIDGKLGAAGWMNGLPRKNARPTPNNIKAMPTAMSLTRGRLQMSA